MADPIPKDGLDGLFMIVGPKHQPGRDRVIVTQTHLLLYDMLVIIVIVIIVIPMSFYYYYHGDYDYYYSCYSSYYKKLFS